MPSGNPTESAHRIPRESLWNNAGAKNNRFPAQGRQNKWIIFIKSLNGAYENPDFAKSTESRPTGYTITSINM